MSSIFNIRNLRLPKLSRASVIIGTLAVVMALVARVRRLPALQEVDQHHGGGLLPGGERAVFRRQGRDHGHPRGFGRQDRARRRQDEGDLPLRQQVQGARQRVGGDPQPHAGGIAEHPVGAALQRRSGAGRQRGDPDRTHPGADGVGPTARQRRQHHLQTRPHPSSPRGHSGTSSSRSPTGWPARASRSTPRSTACRGR